ncbi:MAG: hypothetical protein PHD53_00055 [Methylococcales bacterium]|nr:hypothetical protein [Methylococcales bacterium]
MEKNPIEYLFGLKMGGVSRNVAFEDLLNGMKRSNEVFKGVLKA